jgi:hypothetical protein
MLTLGADAVVSVHYLVEAFVLGSMNRMVAAGLLFAMILIAREMWRYSSQKQD